MWDILSGPDAYFHGGNLPVLITGQGSDLHRPFFSYLNDLPDILYPKVGDIPNRHPGFKAINLHTDRILGHISDTGSYSHAFCDPIIPIDPSGIEDCGLPHQHSIPSAAYRKPFLNIYAAHHIINFGAQHRVNQQPCFPWRHSLRVKIKPHFREGDHQFYRTHKNDDPRQHIAIGLDSIHRCSENPAGVTGCGQNRNIMQRTVRPFPNHITRAVEDNRFAAGQSPAFPP